MSRPSVLFAGSLGGLLNVKYAYLQAQRDDYGFEPIFVPQGREELALLHGAALPTLGRCSLEDVRKAAVVVVEDFPHKSALGAFALDASTVLQLWHGIPLKKIGFPEIASTVNMTPDKARYLEVQYSGYAAVPSTSPWMTDELFSHVFRAGDFPVLGFARNDILLRTPVQRDMLGADTGMYAMLMRHRKAGGTVAVYMPTFRDTGGSFLEDKAMDPLALDAFCARHKILFLAKFHPNLQVEAFRKLNNFVVYDSRKDIYPLLPLADALVTDYSSVYFDYMLLNRPLIFFPYDKEKYLRLDRELFYDYESMTPGVHVRTQDALHDALLRACTEHEDPHAEARRALCAKAFTYKDAHASHRVCCYIRDHLL